MNLPTPELIAERLARHSEPTADGCIVWTGSRAPRGYGRLTINRQTWQAHRAAYLMAHGHLPELSLDHLCRNTSCVNPAHLEPVSLRENNRRMFVALGIGSAQTHCKRGHEYTPEGTYLSSAGGRVCRACQKWRTENPDPRRRNNQRRGQTAGRAKLTEADVHSIRADARTQTHIAAEYGLNSATVSRIKSRQLWSWLP